MLQRRAAIRLLSQKGGSRLMLREACQGCVRYYFVCRDSALPLALLYARAHKQAARQGRLCSKGSQEWRVSCCNNVELPEVLSGHLGAIHLLLLLGAMSLLVL